MTNMIEAALSKQSAAMRNGAAVRRISIICGSVVHYDAVSECALVCLEAAAAQPVKVGPVEVRIYCLETNVSDSRIHVLKSSRDLLAEQFYQNSDFIIYHFGIYSEIHHSLAAAPRGAYIVIHFHGITPPQFLSRNLENLIGTSFIQVGLFSTANEIVVGSAYLGEELKRMGNMIPLRQIDLFGVNVATKPSLKAHASHKKELNVIYCGRFISSKQIIPLLDALESCVDEFEGLTLTLVGVKAYSDQLYLKELERRALSGRVNVVFALDLSPAQVIDAIGAADMLALPSLHEGFGMPVAEGLANLTPVLCSDAGSLPEVSGGLAALFEAADQQSLNTATGNALRARSEGRVLTGEGILSYEEWSKRAQAFSAKYRRPEFVARWQSFIADKLAERKPVGPPSTGMVDGLNFLFQGASPHSSSEAQLLGRLVMLKVLSRLERDDVTGAIDALHRWAFGCPMDVESAALWQGVYDRSGTIGDVLAEMSASAELNSSYLLIRSRAGLTSVVRENLFDLNQGNDSTKALELPVMSRSEVDFVARSAENPEDFIRSLYMNVFKTTPDREGLEYWKNLALDRDNWNAIVETFYGYVREANSQLSEDTVS